MSEKEKQDRKTKNISLAGKASLVAAAALAALVGNVNATPNTTGVPSTDKNTIDILKERNPNRRPMLTLRLNIENPDESLAYMHVSHSSHSSHASHSSHSSHYSHYSGSV
jgi:hypothetical protein